ncbi:reverse transcriptase [Plakobranchus ocellatus]|uniref:Reverse transcriptase n=1 Tax=Plakobranchus ocellatus TaxID=259542 RepID=A0AAV4CIF9_9GAST|nr:reverse transcriptase [Plakobranchus ocellatus]
MAVTPLVEDADIWTVARGTQLLSSEDNVVAQVAWCPLRDTIISGLGHNIQPNDDIPVDAFLSGDNSGGLCRFRHHSTRANIWTRARHATSRLNCRIDASDDEILISAEDVSSVPAKTVKSLRLVSRERWTAKLLGAPVQGRVARGLDLDKTTKDVARLTSNRTSLSFNAWSYWGKLRTNGLAVRGAPGSIAPDKLCRHCRQKQETTSHVVSGCRVHLPEMTGRHDRIQDVLVALLWSLGVETTTNSRAEDDDRAVPDFTVNLGTRESL